MDEPNLTPEARILDRYPEVREKVLASPDFARWMAGLTALDIEGETLYLRGGDMLRDKEQLVFEWARRIGLLSDESIRLVENEEKAQRSGKVP